ncbi:hypothetical protein HK405_005594 [Cladochytrium tenue]|nr:hypothetical protein HK405_005594 [Cladochytrium tenue]
MQQTELSTPDGFPCSAISDTKVQSLNSSLAHALTIIVQPAIGNDRIDGSGWVCLPPRPLPRPSTACNVHGASINADRCTAIEIEARFVVPIPYWLTTSPLPALPSPAAATETSRGHSTTSPTDRTGCHITSRREATVATRPSSLRRREPPCRFQQTLPNGCLNQPVATRILLHLVGAANGDLSPHISLNNPNPNCWMARPMLTKSGGVDWIWTEATAADPFWRPVLDGSLDPHAPGNDNDAAFQRRNYFAPEVTTAYHDRARTFSLQPSSSGNLRLSPMRLSWSPEGLRSSSSPSLDMEVVRAYLVLFEFPTEDIKDGSQQSSICQSKNVLQIARLNSCREVRLTDGYVMSIVTYHTLVMQLTLSVSGASIQPTNDPMLLPLTMSIGIPALSNALMMPTCAMPRAPSPPSTSPMDLFSNRRASRAKSDRIPVRELSEWLLCRANPAVLRACE